MARHRVADQEELKPGELRNVEVAGVRLCLARKNDGKICAISDTCTHEESSLSEGSILGNSVECPSHGSMFDLDTGEVTAGPAQTSVRTYSVSIENGFVMVDMQAKESRAL